MDKHALSYYLLDNIENDEFLQRKYKELLIAYSKSLFSEYSEKYTDEYRKLLRYADMMSLSEKEKHQNIAQQIVILLGSLFPNEEEIGFFKQNIYTNVSNFASANMLCNREEQFNGSDILRDVEVEAHKIVNSIPDTDKRFRRYKFFLSRGINRLKKHLHAILFHCHKDRAQHLLPRTLFRCICLIYNKNTVFR